MNDEEHSLFLLARIEGSATGEKTVLVLLVLTYCFSVLPITASAVDQRVRLIFVVESNNLSLLLVAVALH